MQRAHPIGVAGVRSASTVMLKFSCGSFRIWPKAANVSKSMPTLAG
jgi:hypothetical protein